MQHVRASRLLFWLVLSGALLAGWCYIQARSDESVDTSREYEQTVRAVPKSAVGPDSIKAGSITFDKLSSETIEKLIGLSAASATNTADAFDNQTSGDTISLSTQPAAGGISGSYANGFSVNANAVVLGEHTSGAYVQSIVAGSGLQGGSDTEGSVATLSVNAGDGIAVNTDAVSVNIQPGGGMQFSSGALGLLTSCSDWQILKWNAVSAQWECGADSVGAGGSLSVQESDGTPLVASVADIEFGPALNSSDEFVVTNQGAGSVRIRTGAAVPLTNAAATIGSSWTFSSNIVANGGLSCASCIALGAETSGDYVAGLLAGSGLSLSGSGGEGSTPTVSLDGSLAMFKTIDAALGTDPVADSLTDTLSLTSGNGVTVTGDATADSVSFGLSLASGGGLAFSGSALSLLNSCSDSQFLSWVAVSSEWQCASLAASPLVFKNLSGDTGVAVADTATDSAAFIGGNGLSTVAADAPDTVTINIDLASGSGLSFSGGALTLTPCSDGQFQVWTAASSSWGCATISATPDTFKTITSDSGSAIADGSTDTMTLTGGDGISTSAVDLTDTVTLTIDLASGSGLMFSSGALSLQSCSDGQILKRVAGAWACAADENSLAAAYHQHIAGTNDITYAGTYAPLLRDGGGIAASLPITIQSGNAVDFTATIESTTSLSSGSVSYAVIRDDNLDNDCVTTAGDGTKIGGWIDDFLGVAGQSYTVSFNFTDTAPGTTTPRYQLCASTAIATGATKATDRSLKLQERKL